MQASCHLYLTFCTWGWTILELGKSNPWKSTSSPGLLFPLSLLNILTAVIASGTLAEHRWVLKLSPVLAVWGYKSKKTPSNHQGLLWYVCHQSASTNINYTSLFLGEGIMKLHFFFFSRSFSSLVLNYVAFLSVFCLPISRSTIMKNISFLDLSVPKWEDRPPPTQNTRKLLNCILCLLMWTWDHDINEQLPLC